MIVLYDGDCAVCNRAVKFVAKREKTVRFASLRGETLKPGSDDETRRFVELGRTAGKNVDSIVVVEDAKTYVKSAALIKIGERMGGLWKVLARMAGIAPRSWLDAGYDAFARRRYRWFGKANVCERPSQELMRRILD
ncbi:MAG: DCC1-like thiol-disulfide oxidoreductase family protein [Bacteroidia bacterium]|nr:DCC1-like thiol-disulfide oxidoreductase family protein [Bacteroidia bacterium]